MEKKNCISIGTSEIPWRAKLEATVKAATGYRLSLRTFILASSLTVSFISFASVLGITSLVYLDTVKRSATSLAYDQAQQVHRSIPLLMGKGATRSELLSLYNVPAKSGALGSHTVELYRTPVVEALYGRVALAPDPGVEQVFKSGKVLERGQGHVVEAIFPLTATEKCLGCHGNARTGTLLGALKVRQDIEPMLRHARQKLFLLFLLLSPIPVLMALFIARLVNARVVPSINELGDKVIQVNSIRDLTRVEFSDVAPGFTELDRIFGEVSKLVDKIRAVSVDKEILELEIQMLEKFIITSEVIRDWKEHVACLLLEINQVVDAYMLFCIFQVDEELYDIEIFWRSQPSEATRKQVEQEVLRKIRKENARLAESSALQVIHNVASDQTPLALEQGDMELQTKSLILDSPQIGGVVGIGVQSEYAWNTTRGLVIDSILTTLLNVIGSIKAIHKYTKDLEYYATRDPLTDLFNQRVFWELISYEIGRADRHGYSFALLVIDLDNFKHINDTWGHAIGDRYLAAFAEAVQHALRKGDIFARYGGDEFVILLPESDEEQAALVAARIRNITEDLYVTTPDAAKARATASIGLAMFPLHAVTEKDLFLFADNMTYKAKGEGKNRVSIPTAEDVVEVFRMVGEKARMVQDAVDGRRVMPYFQPIVALGPGGIECCEVLCRIELNGEVIAAGDFIETAESLGIVGRLDAILLEKAFAMVEEQDYRGNLFVNLSPKSMILNEFLPNIIGLADKYRIDRSRVVFELTERETVKNLTLLEKFVYDLKSQGFKFAIDDFGSGFSSFQYIRQFPIDYVKIEGVFVRNMLNDYRDMAFVKTLAILAKEFNISTIAEYIESEEILEAVKSVGIDYAQGYHLGRPSPQLTNKQEQGSIYRDEKDERDKAYG
ncbi:putative bifunctional diguanylate cyclase/phosphodiesterase [Geomonas propionica]|uniref:Bifunctional diguanylate cyclase/phosphodiesterase n=1 Tax=Geomonas propionica TaxID=2798582 RepID=A0ABS0YPU8_9BACT|nr:bifunctional diguanylate cyclase/phosphodiesterase [Geomonas propionica]MBJ6799913.1 bifunctional diguanylate cyclase/phosphodiesterase [Geomonas propionica]